MIVMYEAYAVNEPKIKIIEVDEILKPVGRVRRGLAYPSIEDKYTKKCETQEEAVQFIVDKLEKEIPYFEDMVKRRQAILIEKLDLLKEWRNKLPTRSNDE